MRAVPPVPGWPASYRTSIPAGTVPTVMVPTTLLVAVEITETKLELECVT